VQTYSAEEIKAMKVREERKANNREG
jgi:hypothetical protein